MKDEVERLFRERPRNEEELRERLSSLPAAALRSAMILRLATLGARPCEVPVYVRVFAISQPSREDLLAFSAIVSNSSAPVEGRAVALALARSMDAEEAQRLARSIPQSELLAMNDAQLAVVIGGLASTPFRIFEITEKIARQPSGSRMARFEQIDRIRRRLGVPAAFLYGDLVRRDDLGLGSVVTDLLVEEGGAAASWLFETFWQGALSEAPRTDWMACLTRVFRSPGRAPAQGLSGRAYWSERDHGGSRMAIFALTSPIDSSLSIAWIRFEDGEAAQEGGVKTFADERDLEEVLALCGEWMDSTPREPSTIGQLVETSIRKQKGPSTAVLELFAAASYFSIAKHC